MALVPSFEVYPGITHLLTELHERGVSLAILTKSPDMVAKAMVARHKWPISNIIGYHQVRKRKPDPEGLLLAIKAASANAKNTFHVGDESDDTMAAHEAGVIALGAEWGSEDVAALRSSNPHHLFPSVAELRMFLSKAPA